MADPSLTRARSGQRSTFACRRCHDIRGLNARGLEAELHQAAQKRFNSRPRLPPLPRLPI